MVRHRKAICIINLKNRRDGSVKISKFVFNSGISPPIELDDKQIKSFDLKETYPEHEIEWIKTEGGGRLPKLCTEKPKYDITIITKDTIFNILLRNPSVKHELIGGTILKPKELIYTLTDWTECNFNSSKNKVYKDLLDSSKRL